MNNTPLLVSRREAAKILSIGEHKLWELTRDGRLPAVRFDRVIRYRVADLEAFCAALAGPTPTPQPLVAQAQGVSHE